MMLRKIPFIQSFLKDQKPPSFTLPNDPNTRDDIERMLNPKLEEIIDQRITALHGLKPFGEGPIEIMLRAAEVLVGEKEDPPGSNKGPIISLIQDTVGGSEPWAWCMSYVQTCVAYAEKKTGIKSELFPSEHCMSVWSASPKALRGPISRGAVAIWNYPPGQSGHTGLVQKWAVTTMNCFEGNTSKGFKPDGTIERDGGGVHYTVRSVYSLPKMKLVGFIKPFG